MKTCFMLFCVAILVTGCAPKRAVTGPPRNLQADYHHSQVAQGGVSLPQESPVGLNVYHNAPFYPVRIAADIMLAWVPNHENRHGDFVMEHYFFLKINDGRWLGHSPKAPSPGQLSGLPTAPVGKGLKR